MKTTRFNLLIISIIALLSGSTATAQDLYIIAPDNSVIEIKGTSSLHDWEMNATEFTAESSFSLNENSITSVDQVRFTATVSGLASGKRIMDNKAYEALKENQHPQISFRIDKSHPVNSSDKKITVTGLLKIAGKTKTITFPVDLNVENSGEVSVQGDVPLKMSDFGIEPPTAMMGAVKTDDDITVGFHLRFQKSNETSMTIYDTNDKN